MIRTLSAVAWCLLVCGIVVTAQSRDDKAQTDPISGVWRGELVLDGRSEPVPVTFELKFDGKRTVSGSFVGLPQPGDVKEGTFDLKSGALKLQLGKTGEPPVLLVLEGSVIKGAAAGRFTGEQTGTFKISRKA